MKTYTLTEEQVDRLTVTCACKLRDKARKTGNQAYDKAADAVLNMIPHHVKKLAAE